MVFVSFLASVENWDGEMRRMISRNSFYIRVEGQGSLRTYVRPVPVGGIHKSIAM